jgi:flagellar hook-associated protein 1 FlgK
MVGLSTSLRSLVDSLAVQQESLSYLSDNISNVNTEGYTRKDISLQTQVSNGVVQGVAVANVRRAVDDFLLNAARNQTSQLAQAEIKRDFYERIDNFTFGDPASDFTINNSLGNFFTRLESFANDPSSTVNSSLAVTAAQEFTTVVSDISNSLQNERLNADTEIGNIVERLNTVLTTLDDLNDAIQQNFVAGGNVERLYDVRDVELLKVKEIIDTDFTFDSFGRVSIGIAGLEFLGFTQNYTVDYTPATSVDNFTNDSPSSAIKVIALNEQGERTTNIETLFSATDDPDPVDNLTDGKLKSLIELRDIELPSLLDQVDTLTFTFADQFNAIHNSGSGYPPPEELLGSHSFALADEFDATGKVRITVLDEFGNPVENRLGGDLLPLVIDFDQLDSGNGPGTASVQSIINEINSYYGIQQSQAVNVGPASDVRLVSSTQDLGLANATGRISFSDNPDDGESIIINGTEITFSDTPSSATEVQRAGNLSATLLNLRGFLNSSNDANISQAIYSLQDNTTFIDVTAATAGTTGNSFTLANGSTPSPISVSAATLTGGANAMDVFNFDFELTNLSSDGSPFRFDVESYTINGGTPISANFNSQLYEGGERRRTDTPSSLGDGLSINIASAIPGGLEEGESITIDVDVVLKDQQGLDLLDEDGNPITETLTFEVTMPDPENIDLKNLRFVPTAVSGTGSGEIIQSDSNGSFMTASLVNADGNFVNTDQEQGFLRLKTSNSSYRVVIDELDSNFEDSTIASLNRYDEINRGFSHLFGLNNFFEFNDSLKNSSINISIKDSIVETPSTMTRGIAEKSIDQGSNVNYTYQLGEGTNSTLLELVELQDTNIVFDQAGALPQTSTTIGSYATDIYSYASLLTNNASDEYEKQSLLSEAINEKVTDVSGVDINEQLSRTIEVQTTYAASAKVISTVRDLFRELTDAL